MFKYSNKERSKRRRVQNNFNDLLNDPLLKGNPIFKNLLIYIDQDTVNVSRRGVLHRLIDKYGGRFTTTLSNYVTHVLVDEGFYNGRLSSNFTWTSYPQHMEVIMVTWLSASINANMCLNTAGYRVRSNYRSNLYENIHSYIQDAAYSSNGKDGSSEGTKFDYVSEENSTFDDGKYDDETSCEDEWLLSEPPDIYILPINPIDSDWLPLKRKEACQSEDKKVDGVAVASTSTVSTKDSSEKKVPTEAPFASSNPIVARLSKVRVRMIPKHLRGPGEKAVVVELNNENDPPLPFERTKNVDPVKTDVSIASNDLKETPMSDSKATSNTIDTEVKNAPNVSSTSLSDEINGSPTTPSDLNLSSSISISVTSLEEEHPNEQASTDHEVKCEYKETEKELPIPENILCEKSAESSVEGMPSKEEKDIDSSIKGTEETLSDSNVISECKESNISDTCLLDENKVNQLPSKTDECIMNSSCDSKQNISNQDDTIESNDKTLVSKQISESTCELIDKNQTIESKDESVLMSSSGHSEKQSPPESVNVSELLPSSDSLEKNLVKEVNNALKPENEGKLESKTQVLNEKQVCDNESKENDKGLNMASGRRFSGKVMGVLRKLADEKMEEEQTDDISESEESSKDHEDESEFDSSAKESESKSRRRKFDSSSAEVSDEPSIKKSKDGEFTVEIIDSSSEYSSDDSVVVLSSECETMQNASTNNDSYATGSSDFQSTDKNEVYPLNLYCSSTAGFADSEHVSCEESSTDGITSEVNFSIQRPNGATERINSERFRECINNDTATYVIVNQLKGIPAHCLSSENPAFDDEYDTISTLDHFNKNSSSTSSSPVINTSYQPPRSFSLTNISDPEFPFPIPEPSTSNLQGHFKALGHPSHGQVISTRPDNPNLDIINKLKILYECHKQVGCRWRIHAYEKAIISLSKQYKRVSSIKEAKTLKGVGKTIAGKIWRIAKTGDLREIQEIHNRRWVETMKLFTRVWGISPRIAFQLYKEGLCTIYGLQKKSNLSRGHLVGLRYYEDLKTKMSQEETRLIVSAVLKEVFKMYPNLRADACSSLRRKKLRCGHACILLSLPLGVPNDHRILPDIIARLHQIGFLIDDLIRHEENGDQTRYVGICRLSKKNKHRRLCITLTTKEEHPTALMYLTGPAYFNKAMQQWAIKREMVLDEHSLRYRILNILGGTESVSKLHVSDESLIFQFMGLPYRAPEHRDRIS